MTLHLFIPWMLGLARTQVSSGHNLEQPHALAPWFLDTATRSEPWSGGGRDTRRQWNLRGLLKAALRLLCAAGTELRIWSELSPWCTRDYVRVLFIVYGRLFVQLLMKSGPNFAPSGVH